MDFGTQADIAGCPDVVELTRDWGAWKRVSLYLDRCQVDTPENLVRATWKHVHELRPEVGKVLDFGAGDGRFARHGRYARYCGYEIDSARCRVAALAPNAEMLNQCAFSDEVSDADVCIGNPPFVRNQDLPEGWRLRAASELHRRTGVNVSGLANAWQYFFLLSLASLRDDGLCALVIPYEWVSRPSSKALREYVIRNCWNVSVYRLVDKTFDSVLTTSSITIVDKAQREGVWTYFEETESGAYTRLASPSGAEIGVIPYALRADIGRGSPRAVRGLSPGTQRVLTLTEQERARSGLEIGDDVVPCVTSLRNLPVDQRVLDLAAFRKFLRDPGQKCWLIRTDRAPSPALCAYLDAIPAHDYQTSTCLERDIWWQFKMPPVPDLLILQSFRGAFPKSVRNEIRARAVGGVAGIYNLSVDQQNLVIEAFGGMDIRDRVVAHSNGLRKIEINQLNSLLSRAFLSD